MTSQLQPTDVSFTKSQHHLVPKHYDAWFNNDNHISTPSGNSPSIIRIIKSRRVRWEGHVARMEERRNGYRILIGKPEGRRPLGRSRRR
jgi:hypothetical protein